MGSGPKMAKNVCKNPLVNVLRSAENNSPDFSSDVGLCMPPSPTLYLASKYLVRSNLNLYRFGLVHCHGLGR